MSACLRRLPGCGAELELGPGQPGQPQLVDCSLSEADFALLQRGLRELGPTLMAELPPAERASMAASLLEQVPEAELQSLLLRLMLLRQPPQLLELLEAGRRASNTLHTGTASSA